MIDPVLGSYPLSERDSRWVGHSCKPPQRILVGCSVGLNAITSLIESGSPSKRNRS